MSDKQIGKLHNHLRLLREQYVNLQNCYSQLERRHQSVLSTSTASDASSSECFVTNLLDIVSNLYDKEEYSDVLIKLEGGHVIRSHKFVLLAHSKEWVFSDSTSLSQLDLSDIQLNVGQALIKWVYSGDICSVTEDVFLLQLLRAARRFKLDALSRRCEDRLVMFVDMKNCIGFYESSEEISAEHLRKHCSDIISNNWNDFVGEDFRSMPAPSLYQLIKTMAAFPLHTAIRLCREDVVFICLIESDAQLKVRVNEVDDKGDVPLDLALQSMQEAVAETLLSNLADVNWKDEFGNCLLHKAIKRGDDFSARFLLSHKADPNTATSPDMATPLHTLSSTAVNGTSDDVKEIAHLLLTSGAIPDFLDSSGRTPLHIAVQCQNLAVLSALLMHPVNFEVRNADGFTAVWLAVQQKNGNPCVRFIACLLHRFIHLWQTEHGNCMLHMSAIGSLEAAGMFLAENGASVNHVNHKGETPLHLACITGLKKLVEVLLDKGADRNSRSVTNLQVFSSTKGNIVAPDVIGEKLYPIANQTPLHLAVRSRNKSLVNVMLTHKASFQRQELTQDRHTLPDVNLKDAEGQTALGLAMWADLYDMADDLVAAGADVDACNNSGLSLLHQAVERQDTVSSLFLLGHHANIGAVSPDSLTPLQRAISRRLLPVVRALCQHGADVNACDVRGPCALWQALESEQEEDVAGVLVESGCDVDLWSSGPSRCQQTLLHRAIDENKGMAACFLIANGCDVNSPRRPGVDGGGAEEARDGQGPLHLSCSWGLETVVGALIQHGADVNMQDAAGRTPIHMAIENQHAGIISRLMSSSLLNISIADSNGQTPFACALTTRNVAAARAILTAEPTAADQMNNRGYNFLHSAIKRLDMENVLFLIDVKVSMNSRTRDQHRYTPLHLAVLAGSELIVRNLLLAGAAVNDTTGAGQTVLHLAATGDHHQIAGILLENGIEVDKVDENLNNAFHIGVFHGNLSTIKLLLRGVRVDAMSVNAKGQNALHILSQHGKDNAAAIFDLLLQTVPDYPINKPNADGAGALLLAYRNGNGGLCRSLVRSGACLASVDNDGVSIFNYPVATKQLLFKLLDILSREPPWSFGEECFECGVKFSLKTRKHHWCSIRDMPIVKFGLSKPVRVCDICFDVLSSGGHC